MSEWNIRHRAHSLLIRHDPFRNEGEPKWTCAIHWQTIYSNKYWPSKGPITASLGTRGDAHNPLSAIRIAWKSMLTDKRAMK